MSVEPRSEHETTRATVVFALGYLSAVVLFTGGTVLNYLATSISGEAMAWALVGTSLLLIGADVALLRTGICRKIAGVVTDFDHPPLEDDWRRNT